MTAALGVLGVLLNQVFIWPQVWRARSSVEGLAALTALSGLFARAAWTAYGVMIGDAALIAGNLTVAIGFGLLVTLLATAGSDHTSVLLAAAAAVVAAIAALAATSVTALAVVAVASAAVVNLPQMLRALADRRRLAGVSAATYWLIAAASTCWLLYGVVVDDLVISAPHLILLPSAVITATLASRQ